MLVHLLLILTTRLHVCIEVEMGVGDSRIGVMVILPDQLDDLLGVSIQMRVVLDLSIGSHFLSILDLLTVQELNVIGVDSMWINSINL